MSNNNISPGLNKKTIKFTEYFGAKAVLLHDLCLILRKYEKFYRLKGLWNKCQKLDLSVNISGGSHSSGLLNFHDSWLQSSIKRSTIPSRYLHLIFHILVIFINLSMNMKLTLSVVVVLIVQFLGANAAVVASSSNDISGLPFDKFVEKDVASDMWNENSIETSNESLEDSLVTSERESVPEISMEPEVEVSFDPVMITMSIREETIPTPEELIPSEEPELMIGSRFLEEPMESPEETEVPSFI